MTLFPLRNGHHSITLVCEIISISKVRSREIPSKGEYFSPFFNENIFTFELIQFLVRKPTQTNFVLRLAAQPWLVANM